VEVVASKSKLYALGFELSEGKWVKKGQRGEIVATAIAKGHNLYDITTRIAGDIVFYKRFNTQFRKKGKSMLSPNAK
jgi:hypothetical protein